MNAALAWRPNQTVSEFDRGIELGLERDSNEDAIALHVDDLFGLRNRKVDRVVPVLMRVGPDEVVLFKTAGEVFFDDSGGLILTVYLVSIGRMR
jgi:hypothetical protein